MTEVPNILEVHLYVGLPGTGKTHLMKRELVPYVQSTQRAIIGHDPYGEFEDCCDRVIHTADWEVLHWDDIPDNVLLIIDEAELVCDVHAKRDNVIKRACTQGRHKNVVIFAAAQRAAHVHKVLTGTATHLAVFRYDEATDLKYWEAKRGKEFAEAVKNCKVHPEGYTDSVRWYKYS